MEVYTGYSIPQSLQEACVTADYLQLLRPCFSLRWNLVCYPILSLEPPQAVPHSILIPPLPKAIFVVSGYSIPT